MDNNTVIRYYNYKCRSCGVIISKEKIEQDERPEWILKKDHYMYFKHGGFHKCKYLKDDNDWAIGELISITSEPDKRAKQLIKVKE